MHTNTQYQRFSAMVLLFGVLLQSCGNPNWKLADQEAGGVCDEVGGPAAGEPQEPVQTA